ncbi:hypothetical protein GCM10022419_131850 [Nonomuraea rosea]|uniref:Uncharacterized protein n=1 Tax=Nonomuraea rosea TaxID=638574 RepID=A0ABP7A2R6_9ACTN
MTSIVTLASGLELSQEEKRTHELTAGFSIESMFTLGQKLGSSSSSGIRWTDSVTRAFTTVASRSRTFTEGHTKHAEISGEIPAASPGRRQSLYAYPVVGLYDIPVVVYGGANDLGQATTRKTASVPVVWLRGWGTKVILT